MWGISWICKMAQLWSVVLFFTWLLAVDYLCMYTWQLVRHLELPVLLETYLFINNMLVL